MFHVKNIMWNTSIPCMPRPLAAGTAMRPGWVSGRIRPACCLGGSRLSAFRLDAGEWLPDFLYRAAVDEFRGDDRLNAGGDLFAIALLLDHGERLASYIMEAEA